MEIKKLVRYWFWTRYIFGSRHVQKSAKFARKQRILSNLKTATKLQKVTKKLQKSYKKVTKKLQKFTKKLQKKLQKVTKKLQQSYVKGILSASSAELCASKFGPCPAWSELYGAV